MPTRTSALRRIGRVIILHDPFFSRTAASRVEHFLLRTTRARYPGSNQSRLATQSSGRLSKLVRKSLRRATGLLARTRVTNQSRHKNHPKKGGVIANLRSRQLSKLSF
jgi:hypothetical protein